MENHRSVAENAYISLTHHTFRFYQNWKEGGKKGGGGILEFL